MAHDVQWYSPAPLWPKRLQNGTSDRLQTPELLQFEQDDFMSDLQKTLEETPNNLDEKRAKGEKYLGGDGSPESVDGPIPLYQPAHERYYLVTASLVCRERGLPDRAVDTANEEKAAFVLRRLVPDASGSVDVDGEPHAEYRWVKTSAKENGSSSGSSQNGAAKAEGKTGEWRRVDNPLDVPEREERLSMFPQSYTPQTPVEQMKGKRRLWAGLIPVAKRETYETAPIQQTSGDDSSPPIPNDPSADSEYALDDPRKTKFETRIMRAFKELRDNMMSADSLTPTDVRDPLLFTWLDFWQFLREHLPKVAAKIKEDESAEAADFEERGTEKVDLISTLNGALSGPEIGSLGPSSSAILRTVADKEGQIKSGNLDDVLAEDELPPINSGKDDLVEVLNDVLDPNTAGQTLDEQRPSLQKTVYAALGPLKKLGELPANLQPPSTEPIDGGRYVVRCLYERPNCPPPRKTMVSEPSRPFRLASFFDAQAPPRDINITLPGARVQDFRDSSQSVTMRFTKELRKQAQRVQDLSIKAVDNGNVGPAPKVNIGMICSLSIPIITICALILLLIIVVALNIVFWWLPFFKICFPLPSSDG